MAYRRLIITAGKQQKIKDDLESLFNRVGPDFPDVKTKIVTGVKPDTLIVDLNGDGADSMSYKANDIAKKNGAQVKIKKEKSLAIKENRIEFKRNGTARDLYKIIQKDNDALVFANGNYYFIDLNDLKADIDATDSIYGVEKSGKETMIHLKDIEFINTFPKIVKEGDENTPVDTGTSNHNDFAFKKTPAGIEFYTNKGKRLLGTIRSGDYYISTTGIKECAFIKIALNTMHIPSKKEDVYNGHPNLIFSHTALVKLLTTLRDHKNGQVKVTENIDVPISVGDVVLGGKFKNKKVTVKTIEKNDNGDLTINGKPLLRYRIITQPKVNEGTDTTPSAAPIKPVLSREKTFASAWSDLLIQLIQDKQTGLQTWGARLSKTDEVGLEGAKYIYQYISKLNKSHIKGLPLKQAAYNCIIKTLHNEKIT